MCTVCSSGDVQTKFYLLPRFLNHVSCYSFNGWSDPFLQVLDIPYLLSIHSVTFMQDGAPPHFSCFETDVLNERFPDAWTGRGGPIPWQPRSPDLSPLDFFLWGYIKNTVYGGKIMKYPAPARKDHISHWNCNTRRDSENVAGDRISFGHLQSYKRCTYWIVLRYV